MALTTAIAFLFLGFAIVFAVGPERLPLSLLAGSSTRAKLLRTFLPLVALIIFITDIGHNFLVHGLKVTSVLLVGLSIMTFEVIVAFVIFRTSTLISRRIDSAEKERKKAENELRRLKDNLEIEVKEKTEKIIEMQSYVFRTEKLAALGRLAGTVAHELRTPLGALKNSVYFLKSRLAKGQSDEKVDKHLGLLNEEINASDRIITNILTFVRVKEPQLAETDINFVVKSFS